MSENLMIYVELQESDSIIHVHKSMFLLGHRAGSDWLGRISCRTLIGRASRPGALCWLHVHRGCQALAQLPSFSSPHTYLPNRSHQNQVPVAETCIPDVDDGGGLALVGVGLAGEQLRGDGEGGR